MGDYVISCCSTADLNDEYMRKREINYISFHYFMDDVEYLDDMGKSFSTDEFYQKMQEGADTRTSQVNADEYAAYFEEFLKDGKDILHLTVSSGISGTINSANIAKEELAEKYPDRKIYVIDSLCISGGFGLLMDNLADLRDEGKSIEELVDYAMSNRLRVHHWFFSTDLTFYIKGGRISKTSGFVGGILNICPLLNVDSQGRLVPKFKIRTMKKAILTTVEQMILYAQSHENYSGKCFINYSYNRNIAEELGKLIEEKFPNLKNKIFYNSVGTTIGSHTGPGTVALFFMGDMRVD